MLRFVLRRCALVVPSLLGLLVITFLLIHAVPSDPAAAMAGDAATPEQIARLRVQYGLDQPMWRQFIVYLDKVAHFDFGESAFSRRPVAREGALAEIEVGDLVEVNDELPPHRLIEAVLDPQTRDLLGRGGIARHRRRRIGRHG